MRILFTILMLLSVVLTSSCQAALPGLSERASGSPTLPAGALPPSPTVTTARAGLNPTPPYILFAGSSGIWIANPDGSYLTRIANQQNQLNDLHRTLSPGGDRLALIVQDDQGIELIEVRLPGGETRTISRILSSSDNELTTESTSPQAIASYAITRYDSLAWQPGKGRLLAFIGAMDGPTADLYIFDTLTGAVTRLTDGPSQAIYPSWSPDGQYILTFGVGWDPPFGGAIVGYNRMDGLWAVRASDGQVIDQPRPSGFHSNFVGWQDDQHYLIFDSDEECGARNLRGVDLVSTQAASVLDGSFDYPIARSPENGGLLFSSAANCPDSLGMGVFLLAPGQRSPTQLLDRKAYEIRWLPESAVFQAYPEALFSADGSRRYDPPLYEKSFHPAISVRGYQAWEVIENQQGRVVVKVPGGEWKTILSGHVADLIWDPIRGDTLLIALQDGTLHRAAFPDFSPRQVGEFGDRIDQAIWVPQP